MPRLVVISIRVFVKRAAAGAGRSPWQQRAACWVIPVGARCGTLSRHTLAAGAVAGGLALSQAFAGPGLSELLGLLGGLSVAVIAVSAVLRVARHNARPGQVICSRAIIRASFLHIAPVHRQLPAARAMHVLCTPRPSLETTLGRVLHPRALLAAGAGPLFGKAARWALKSLALRPALKLIPGLGPAIELAHAYQTSLASVRFLRDFERAAAELCAASAA